MSRTRKNLSYKIGHVLYRSVHALIMHDGMEMAGYLTFLGMLALFPFIIFLVSLAGFLGEIDKGGQFVVMITSHLPKDFIRSLQPRIHEIISSPPQGLMTIAVIGTLWTSSSAVEGIRQVLNRAHNVQSPPSFILRRIFSIFQLILLSILIVIAMLFMTVVPVVWGWIERKSNLTNLISPDFTYLRYALSFLSFYIAVATSYYILPNKKQRWQAITPGAVLTVVLWMLAAEGLRVYLHLFNQLNLVYGSLAGLIISMLFFYILAVIYIAGAEFNHQLAEVTGKRKHRKKS